MSSLLTPLLPSPCSIIHLRRSVRANAAWVLGNAVKNDPIFQQWALDVVEVVDGATSALSRLLTMLVSTASLLEKEGGKAAMDERRRRAVYAITSASRNNPEVRAELLKIDGLKAMAGLLTCDHASTPLKVKAATFVHDLLSEEAHVAAETGAGGEGARLLKEAIGQAEKAWCGGLQSLMVEAVSDPRLLERTVEAAVSLAPHCPAGTFEGPAKGARQAWGQAREEVDEEYRKELVAAIDRLGTQRDEL